MLDTIISWINPAATLREFVIGLIIAVVGGFAYAKTEKQWERLTGYASARSKRESEFVKRSVATFEAKPHTIPLLASMIHTGEFLLILVTTLAIAISLLHFAKFKGVSPHPEFTFSYISHILAMVAIFTLGVAYIVVMRIWLRLTKVRSALLTSAIRALNNAAPEVIPEGQVYDPEKH